MSLDFHLRQTQQSYKDRGELVRVLVQFRNDVSVLRELGCKVTSVFGDIAAVAVEAENLEQLQEHPDVVFVEASRALKDETDVSAGAINLIDAAGLRAIPGNGRGAIIGFIDSGFDLTHPSFLNAHNKTRILAAWDQKNLDKVPGAPPQEFGYGREYTRESINERLAAKKIVVVKNQEGAGSHGTYVAGIAAGNGTRTGIYKGIAPECDLILVTYLNDVPVGGSAFVLDAINYIQRRAGRRPVVINISQGDNLGAHDGTSLLERAIDNVVKQGRVLVVTSAGNERAGSASHHARGEVEQDRDLALKFALGVTSIHRVKDDTIEIWYDRSDRFNIALETPGGKRSDFVVPDMEKVIEYPSGKQVKVYSETNHPTNGDNRIGIVFEEHNGWEPGVWRLILRGVSVRRGDFDAWSDRPNGATVIGFQSHQSDASTVTLPGNARRAITVGGFVSRPMGDGKTIEVKGAISSGSSIGPTRDGRIKPDLMAPSSLVMAPRMRVDTCQISYDLNSGTSMAAPHVSGVIALMWGLWPELRAEQIRAALLSTAGDDTFTGATPNTSWGHGKLDTKALYKALSILVEKGDVPMREQQVFKFDFKAQPKADGTLAGMSVRIEVTGDDAIVITGVCDGETYVGTLILQKKQAAAGTTVQSPPEEMKASPLGGDECWVSGVWVNPCPIVSN